MRDSICQIKNMSSLIEHLSHFRTIDDLSKKINCSTRHVYRILKDLEDYGFLFEQKTFCRSKKLRLYHIPEEFSNQVIKLAGLVQRQSIG